MAHVIGTERMLAGDTPPELPPGDYPHALSPLGEFNEAWVESYRGSSADEMLAALRDVTARRMDALRSMTTEEFDKVGFSPVGDAPYRVFMRVRAFDIWTHEQDIRRAVDRPGNLDSAPAHDALDWLLRSAPMVVGKRAQAPLGSTVVFEITGGAPRTVAILVAQRAGVVDDVPADPTVALGLDSEHFCRLASGRLDGESALADGLVGIDGDESLGQQIVTSLNVVP